MIMDKKVPAPELQGRLDRFRARMDADNPGWEIAAFFGRINQYYFTGTIQDGVVLIPRDGEPVFWVRKSLERAQAESEFSDIRPMRSYRDAAAAYPHHYGQLHTETEVVPIAVLNRFCKYFPVPNAVPLDTSVGMVRAVKSPYEIGLMEKAGEIHCRVLEDRVPGILREGMTEAEFGAAVYSILIEEGHFGIVRFGGFNIEIEVGQIGFGTNSLYPTYFDGPGGCVGCCPAAPVLGSPERKLQSGDLVFIDNACGVSGYQTDKTMTYMFGSPLPGHAMKAHEHCVDIMDKTATLLRPDAKPSDIYSDIMESLDSEFLENFMGFGDRRAGFLGHGTGLQVDEFPVITPGFDEPLVNGMAIAIEPKKGEPGVGMVGIENTFLVTPQGGRSITGKSRGLIPVW